MNDKPASAASRVDASATEPETAPAEQSAEPELDARGKAARWVGALVMLYLLVCAVDVIGDGFGLIAGDRAEGMFEFATNPFVGLAVGILGTVLMQSSSTTTAITVGLVAGGLPVEIAVPMIMGANVGTTITNTLASLANAGKKDAFRRSFAAATVHDVFNLLAIVVILPLELLTGFLARTAGALAGSLRGADGADPSQVDVLDFITSPVLDAFTGFVAAVTSSDLVEGIVLAAAGVVGILVSVRVLGVLLGQLMVGRAKRILHATMGRGPVSGVAAGAGVTVLAQSSSVTTSLMIPLAGSGTVSLKQIYPYTVGANIGTTFTAILASLAASQNQVEATQIAFVHLGFNLVATLVIFVLPFLRQIPMQGATLLANQAVVRPWIVVVWVLGVFVAVPAAVILLSVTGGIS
ncbi:Na/Pi cotransporter family protein [Ornithinimicrobium pratense]|uniref:Na/Pi cotransporter family protein n=1 Tax=Ornithinimicrobium pratense TaxID=2593973 RepID=A0A5J6V713_9MICO|nr:Na/Pi cotransporter family protein [Ornithinimicrobium pratense]QFG69585.1 Na/Pi cotransporter family protein [Ornithinimicrobium pratense]